MNKLLIEKAINETRESLDRYYHRDCEYVSSFFDENVVWIGALQSQFVQGKEAVYNSLKGITMVDCYLSKQEFWCVSNGRNTCTIVGRYYVTTENYEKEILSEQQRCTFSWRVENGKLVLMHMHTSSPLTYLESDENFPHGVGQSTYKYLRELLKEHEKNDKMLTVKDTKGHLRFINTAEIEFAEANRHNTIIYTDDEKIEIRMLWSDFIQKLCVEWDAFVRVHRSYVVCKKRINLVDKKNIELTSGRKIPYTRLYLENLFKEFK